MNSKPENKDRNFKIGAIVSLIVVVITNLYFVFSWQVNVDNRIEVLNEHVSDNKDKIKSIENEQYPRILLLYEISFNLQRSMEKQGIEYIKIVEGVKKE
jgi:hypothetical protein